MKRATREVLVRAISFMRTDIWHEDAEHLLHLDARQRAEICRLRRFVRGCSTYVCACGDGDICVGCAARQVLRGEL